MVFIDVFLAPLLGWPQLAALLVIAFCVSIIMTLVYKWMTDQTVMKTLRDELKSYQKQMKETKDTDHMLALQKKAMDANMQYLLKSLKPTLLTMLPVLLIFGWLSAHFAYEPLYPDKEFSIIAHVHDGIMGKIVLEAPELIVDQPEKEIANGQAVWKVKGKAGDFVITFKAKDHEYEKDIVISTEQRYAIPEKKISDNILEIIEVPMQKLVVLNLFGWKLGWLGTYILFSLIFSITLRKLLDVQ